MGKRGQLTITIQTDWACTVVREKKKHVRIGPLTLQCNKRTQYLPPPPLRNRNCTAKTMQQYAFVHRDSLIQRRFYFSLWFDVGIYSINILLLLQ